MLLLPFPLISIWRLVRFGGANLLLVLYTYHLNFQLGDTCIYFSQSPIQQENGTPISKLCFFLSSSSFQDFPCVFHVFSLKGWVFSPPPKRPVPFRALRTHHGGYITPPSAHRGGPPGRDVTTERASWISTVPTNNQQPPGGFWLILDATGRWEGFLFCCLFQCLCLKVRFKRVF